MSLGLDGLSVGHWTDPDGLTGCTVVIPPAGNVASVSVCGGGASTRETDLLSPSSHLQGVSAVLLTGGSAFGLAAAQGVAAWCEANGIGYDRFGPPIPIVAGAVIFDLGVGDWGARPGPDQGMAACEAAGADDGPMGNVGAGMGATVGKFGGPDLAMKGGLGWAVLREGDLAVGALAVVNAAGDVIGADGRVIAGTRLPGGVDAAVRAMLAGGVPAPGGDGREPQRSGTAPRVPPAPPGGNTTLGLVATNAKLTKQEVNRVAVQAQDGLARAVRPAHTSFDGDTVFAVAAPAVPAPVDLIAFLAEEALAGAIRAGVLAASPVAGIPAARAGLDHAAR